MKKKKYILAVSGGIDSIMLLDLFAKNIKKEDLLVAHFDHGIRDNSYLDALFVKRLADNYKIDFDYESTISKNLYSDRDKYGIFWVSNKKYVTKTNKIKIKYIKELYIMTILFEKPIKL